MKRGAWLNLLAVCGSTVLDMFAFARRSFSSVADVAAWRLCLGCGACSAMCPHGNIELHDVPAEGVRPLVRNPEHCLACSRCLDVCPGYENDRTALLERRGADPAFSTSFGPVLEAWEGFATDPELRHKGASGGVMTALALYCLEQAHMHGVLHVGGVPGQPLRNRTRLSRSRRELLSCTGSRYAPASACDRLDLAREAPGPCVFVGQPSEVTALRKAQAIDPALRSRIGLVISFLCAGTPSSRGTQELLRRTGVDEREVEEIRYRGHGWPGTFAVRRRGQERFETITGYRESWDFLARYRPLSVHLNPDVSGENADVSCGDPWYRDVRRHAPGLSVLLVRTEAGRAFVHGAMEAGYLQLTPLDVQARRVIESQKAGLKRGAVWGRVLVLKAFGIPVTRLRGFRLFRDWLGLPLREKLRSTLGTVRRILLRGYLRPQRIRA